MNSTLNKLAEGYGEDVSRKYVIYEHIAINSRGKIRKFGKFNNETFCSMKIGMISKRCELTFSSASNGTEMQIFHCLVYLKFKQSLKLSLKHGKQRILSGIYD